MKPYVELFLVAILLVLMYDRPEPLVKFSNSTLGKIILVLTVLSYCSFLWNDSGCFIRLYCYCIETHLA